MDSRKFSITAPFVGRIPHNSYRGICGSEPDFGAYCQQFLLASAVKIGTRLCFSMLNLPEYQAIQSSTPRIASTIADSGQDLALHIDGLHHRAAAVQRKNDYNGRS